MNVDRSHVRVLYPIEYSFICASVKRPARNVALLWTSILREVDSLGWVSNSSCTMEPSWKTPHQLKERINTERGPIQHCCEATNVARIVIDTTHMTDIAIACLSERIEQWSAKYETRATGGTS